MDAMIACDVDRIAARALALIIAEPSLERRIAIAAKADKLLRLADEAYEKQAKTMAAMLRVADELSVR